MAPLLEVHCYFSWLGHSQIGTSNEWVGHVIASLPAFINERKSSRMLSRVIVIRSLR